MSNNSNNSKLDIDVLVTGAGGMLGTAVCEHLRWPYKIIPYTHAELDVTDAEALQRIVLAKKPAIIIHLAAWTDVDGCQEYPERAYTVNATSTETVVNLCREHDIILILVSSLAVFDGEQLFPYSELDTPIPINIYGFSKWLAEQWVKTVPRHYIIRSGWLFGGGEKDKKFVRLILNLAEKQKQIEVVDDCLGSPTYVVDLARGIERLLIEKRPFGIYHILNDGPPPSPVTN